MKVAAPKELNYSVRYKLPLAHGIWPRYSYLIMVWILVWQTPYWYRNHHHKMPSYEEAKTIKTCLYGMWEDFYGFAGSAHMGMLYIPSSLEYMTTLSRQLNYWSLRCSWSITCRRCSTYIFIYDLTPGLNGLGKDNCRARQESFRFWDLVRLKLEIIQ